MIHMFWPFQEKIMAKTKKNKKIKKNSGCFKVKCFYVENVFRKIRPFIENRNAGFGSLV